LPYHCRQLGVGNIDNQSIPTEVQGLSNIAGVIAGHDTHTLFVQNDGSIWACGFATQGVGLPEFAMISTPVPVENICAPAAIETYTTLDVSMYPNPFQDFIQLESRSEEINYSIFNSTGELMSEGTLSGFNSKVNTSSWPAGLYTIHLRSEHEDIYGKLIRY